MVDDHSHMVVDHMTVDHKVLQHGYPPVSTGSISLPTQADYAWVADFQPVRIAQIAVLRSMSPKAEIWKPPDDVWINIAPEGMHKTKK